VEQVRDNPVMPTYIGANQAGMQAAVEVEDWEKKSFRADVLKLRRQAMALAKKWGKRVHKQTVNRYLEPWFWITIVLSATEWMNFFSLRCHADAQPEFRYLAEMVALAYHTNKPQEVEAGYWHLPLLLPEERAEWPIRKQKAVSVARCARVSYLTHSGKRDPEADLKLYEQLVNGSGGAGHFSPFEHVAQAMEESVRCGNFIGWMQHRKEFAWENHEGYVWKPTYFEERGIDISTLPVYYGFP
jgi:hypothetical protein